MVSDEAGQIGGMPGRLVDSSMGLQLFTDQAHVLRFTLIITTWRGQLQGLRLAETAKHWFLLLKYASHLPHVLLFAIDNCYPLFPVGVHLLFFFPRFLRTHKSQEGVIRSVSYRDGNNKSQL